MIVVWRAILCSSRARQICILRRRCRRKSLLEKDNNRQNKPLGSTRFKLTRTRFNVEPGRTAFFGGTCAQVEYGKAENITPREPAS